MATSCYGRDASTSAPLGFNSHKLSYKDSKSFLFIPPFASFGMGFSGVTIMTRDLSTRL